MRHDQMKTTLGALLTMLSPKGRPSVLTLMAALEVHFFYALLSLSSGFSLSAVHAVSLECGQFWERWLRLSSWPQAVHRHSASLTTTQSLALHSSPSNLKEELSSLSAHQEEGLKVPDVLGSKAASLTLHSTFQMPLDILAARAVLFLVSQSIMAMLWIRIRAKLLSVLTLLRAPFLAIFRLHAVLMAPLLLHS
tara:strand:+ start:197 stop:778 length:582 start_codon:yes stop_codon:yes gene_type:complete